MQVQVDILMAKRNEDSYPSAAQWKCTGFVMSCTFVSNPLYVVSIIYMIISFRCSIHITSTAEF